jgi:hypothetical protein
MAPERISTVYFINPSLSLCFRMYIPLPLPGNAYRHVPAATNTSNRIVGGVIFYTLRVVLKESVRVGVFPLISLLGNSSINTFPLQRRITAIHALSTQSRQLYNDLLQLLAGLSSKMV